MRFAVLAMVGIASLATRPAPLASQEAQGAPQAQDAPGTPPPPEPVRLSSIPAEREAFVETAALIRTRWSEVAPLEAAEAELRRLEGVASELASDRTLERAGQISTGDLFELNRRARVELAEVDNLSEVLGALASQAEADLDALAALADRWTRLDSVAVDRSAPAAIRGLVSRTVAEASSLSGVVRARRDQLLVSLARTAEIRGRTNAVRSELARRQAAARAELLGDQGLPIWRLGEIGGAGIALAGLVAEMRADAQLMFEYFRTDGFRVLLTLLIPGLLALALLVRLRQVARRDPDVANVPGRRVLEWPFPGALLVALLTVAYATPSPPAFFSVPVWGLIPFPAAILAESLLGRGLRRSIWAAAFAVALLPLGHYLQMVPLLDRVITLVQLGGLGTALYMDWRAGAWDAVLRARWTGRLVKWGIVLSLAVIVVGILCAVMGWIGPGRTLRNGAVAHVGFAMVYFAAAGLAWVAFDVALASDLADELRLGPKQKATLRRWVRGGVVVLAVAAWAAWTLLAYQVGIQVFDGIRIVLGTTIEVGALSIDLGSVLLFIAVILAAFALAGIVCFVLEEEFLPRLTLARGVAYAVTTASRYAILFGGFVLATIAAGFDLSRATLLAGAFGVGLGFGLQDVVNNFISGIILMFERPIQPGDIVEVGSVMGHVTRIGIRSSTVKTFQGAEVVVPNGSLISGSVTNWTLSNRRRRIEIAVGVAYGTDTARTRDILAGVARENPGVSDDPEPIVLFQGFGDSALEFELRCWVDSMDDALAVASELRFAISAALDEAGIEIPFPQRDVHVKDLRVPPTASDGPQPAPASPERS